MRFLILLLLPLTVFSQTKTVQVFFKRNVSTLEKEATQILLSLEKKGSTIQVLSVTAYTDATGSDAVNTPLATSRLNVVVDHLKNAGISVGSSAAPACNYPENAKRLNDLAYWRRVDILYEEVKNSTELEFNGIKLTTNEKELQPIPLTIEFHNASDYVKEYSLPELDKLFQFLNQHQQVSIFIRGHVCCMDDYDISYLRAKTVYDYLVKRGITQDRLGFQGYSNTIPLVTPELTEEDQQRNRRVDVIFTIK
jgi:outer membrane protein OmpA-like peptidoglycan-associated protein